MSRTHRQVPGRYRIDLRSDIHTAPTSAMRRAMAAATVGGDALAGEDAIVVELEESCAALFRKEAALFVCSGTMGNIASLLAISQPGCALIADSYTHLVSSEGRGYERLAGCHLVAVETDGVLSRPIVRQCLEANGLQRGSAVICVENTHSLRGGIPWGTDVMQGLADLAREHDFRLHIDGARIFNAAVATGESVADLAAGADTLQVCLSKGLGAPMGSVVMGSAEIIDRAREYRQMLGGGIHKAGLMAAAGLVALREMPDRIPEDHRRAKWLGDLLCELPQLGLAYPVQTNIVDLAFDPRVLDGGRLVAWAARRGVGITGPWTAPWGGWLRLVTYHQISDADVEEAAAVLARGVKESMI
jgi:threonine aldolase